MGLSPAMAQGAPGIPMGPCELQRNFFTRISSETCGWGTRKQLHKCSWSWLIARQAFKELLLAGEAEERQGKSRTTGHPLLSHMLKATSSPASLPDMHWRGCSPHRVPSDGSSTPLVSRPTAHVALLLLLIAIHSAAVPSLPGATPEQPGQSN